MALSTMYNILRMYRNRKYPRGHVTRGLVRGDDKFFNSR